MSADAHDPVGKRIDDLRKFVQQITPDERGPASCMCRDISAEIGALSRFWYYQKKEDSAHTRAAIHAPPMPPNWLHNKVEQGFNYAEAHASWAVFYADALMRALDERIDRQLEQEKFEKEPNAE